MKKNFEASNPPPNYNRSWVISQHKDILQKKQKNASEQSLNNAYWKTLPARSGPTLCSEHVEVRGRESREINITARRAL